MSPPEFISARRAPVAQLPKERSIPFKAPMVRAVLDDSKTQTRRIMKVQPQKKGSFWEVYGAGWSDRITRVPAVPGHSLATNCPYGMHGEHLWVREAYRLAKPFDKDRPSHVGVRCLDAGYPKAWAPVQYEADGSRDNWISVGTVSGIPEPGKLRPGMFMCRWLSRIDLEVCSARIERLQDISEADAIAEGVERNWSGDLHAGPNGYGGEGWVPECGWHHYLNSMDGDPAYTAVESYRSLWEQINGAGSWEANPWVWVVTFKRIEP